jgi:hypothetical protein
MGLSEEQKKPGAVFWATIVMAVALVGYPLSMGPAHLIECSIDHPYVWREMDAVYRPLALICGRSELATRVAYRYADFWGWRRPRIASGVWLPPGFELEIVDN